MPVYHSKFNELEGVGEIAGFAVLPVKTAVRGPAVQLPKDDEETKSGDSDDIIDEAILYFRANVLFKSFEIKGGADRMLAYLTLFIQLCLKKIERVKSKAEGVKLLQEVGRSTGFTIPGDSGWTLGTMFPAGGSPAEKESLRALMRQYRQETALRLEDRLFFHEGSPNKFWLQFSKKKFMGKQITA